MNGQLGGDAAGSQAVLTQKSLVDELPRSLSDLDHYALALDLEVLGDVWVGESSTIDEFERLKKKQQHFLEEGNDYKMETEKLETTLLEKEVAMKEMTLSVVDLGRTVNSLET